MMMGGEGKKDSMFELMRQWEESDDDRISFCKANGLALASLSYWRTKYRNPHFASPSQDFFELKPTSRLVLEIDYANGVVVRFPSQVLRQT